MSSQWFHPQHWWGGQPYLPLTFSASVGWPPASAQKTHLKYENNHGSIETKLVFLKKSCISLLKPLNHNPTISAGSRIYFISLGSQNFNLKISWKALFGPAASKWVNRIYDAMPKEFRIWIVFCCFKWFPVSSKSGPEECTNKKIFRKPSCITLPWTETSWALLAALDSSKIHDPWNRTCCDR